MTQPNHKYTSLLLSVQELDKFAEKVHLELANLHELTNYNVDPCLYLHGDRCSQCGVTDLVDKMQDIGYYGGRVVRFIQETQSKTHIFLTLHKINAKMGKLRERIHLTHRAPKQFFPNEVIIINDLVLEV